MCRIPSAAVEILARRIDHDGLNPRPPTGAGGLAERISAKRPQRKVGPASDLVSGHSPMLWSGPGCLIPARFKGRARTRPPHPPSFSFLAAAPGATPPNSCAPSSPTTTNKPAPPTTSPPKPPTVSRCPTGSDRAPPPPRQRRGHPAKPLPGMVPSGQRLGHRSATKPRSAAEPQPRPTPRLRTRTVTR